MQNVFKQIEELNDQYVDIWEDVCNIESPSNDKDGVDQVGTYFRKLAEKHGWKVETLEQERFGNVICITMNPESPNAPVAISGHMDTVHPVGSFGTPAVKRRNNKLYGPGVMDCKGGIVAGFLAMDALQHCRFQNRPVMMILQSNEEIGSGLDNKEPIKYICEKAKNAVAFLNLEGHDEYFIGKACLIRKGIAQFQFCVKGIAAHSSFCAKEGANAIAEASHKIIEIEKIKDDSGITCNCSVISGGTTTNSVPNACIFHVDVRFLSQAQYEEAFALLQTIADKTSIPGCTCSMVQTNLRPPMELNQRNIALLDKVNEIFTQSGLSQLEIGMRTGGSDASDVSAYGIPCIDCLGIAGGRIHSTEEYGEIDSLSESAKRLAAIVCGV